MNYSKTEQLILYILQSMSYGVTGILKLCYLVDLASVRKSGKQITDFKYVRYNYGPFDSDIYPTLNNLQNHNALKVSYEVSKHGSDFVAIYNYNEENKIKFGFKEEELEVIKSVVDSLEGYGAKALTELAYATAPMKALGATLGGNENLGVKLDLTKQ